MSVVILLLLTSLFQTCVLSQIDRTVRTCENSELSLKCNDGRKLNIISANYGRNAGPEICPHSSIKVTSGCNAESSLDIVRETCQNRRMCSIEASNSVFGDPCYLTYKYLEVTYSCLFMSTDIACENSELSLECDEGKTLNIISANYGRNAGPEVCPHQSIKVTSGCNADSSLDIVRETCQNRRMCSIEASNSVFGDPCYLTYKYLEVTYSCLFMSTDIACENSELSLKCDEGKTLNIISANYGRNAGPEVCPHQSIKVTSGCNADSSLDIVRETCQNRRMCSIEASNSVFGDPCYLTYKYLEVTYFCQKHCGR